MTSQLAEMFEDRKLIEKIKRRLPYLFQIAEVESMRGGKVAMEVGSPREKILTALLIYKFGERNVETDIPVTERETDAIIFGQPVSIKTITGSGGVKLSWTVDAPSAKTFLQTYVPKCDILLAQINWGKAGNLYYIPREAQQRVFKNLGERYFKLPKVGTNPRGVEFSKEGLSALTKTPETKSIEIEWQRSEIDYNPYQRWLDYWKKEELPYDTKNIQTKIE